MAAVVGADLIQSQEPGVPSRSPMWMQVPGDLSYALLLSQALSRELDLLTLGTPFSHLSYYVILNQTHQFKNEICFRFF